MLAELAAQPCRDNGRESRKVKGRDYLGVDKCAPADAAGSPIGLRAAHCCGPKDLVGWRQGLFLRVGCVSMARTITVGAAQLGPIQRADSRTAVVKRMLDLLRQAGEHKCNLVVFPELALTTFFPRWWMTDQEEIDSFFEREMPGN